MRKLYHPPNFNAWCVMCESWGRDKCLDCPCIGKKYHEEVNDYFDNKDNIIVIEKGTVQNPRKWKDKVRA